MTKKDIILKVSDDINLKQIDVKRVYKRLLTALLRRWLEAKRLSCVILEYLK